VGRAQGARLNKVAAASGSISKPSWQENRLVTKLEIARTISEGLGLTQLQTKQIIQNILDSIVSTLVEEGRVELRNFGVFEVRWRKARNGRNPRTGEKIIVPKRCTVTFKPGLVMEERVAEEGRRHESTR
jgi:nucleoid DNA-binding protein